MGESLGKALNKLTPAGMLDPGMRGAERGVRGESEKRRVEVETSTRDTALIFFFVRLLNRLQRVGTVPAMDVMKYAEKLETRFTTGRDNEVKWRRKSGRP